MYSSWKKKKFERGFISQSEPSVGYEQLLNFLNNKFESHLFESLKDPNLTEHSGGMGQQNRTVSVSHSELCLFLLPNCSSLKDMIKQNQVCEVCVEKDRNNRRALLRFSSRCNLKALSGKDVSYSPNVMKISMRLVRDYEHK